MKKLALTAGLLVTGATVFFCYRHYQDIIHEKQVLKAIITRLEADSMVAEVLVTDVEPGRSGGGGRTTIKLLEYASDGTPLEPRHFSFTGNVIQFQSLVIRFDDILVRNGDALRGKSAYILWKVFMLNGKDTEEYELVKLHEIPNGYKVPDLDDPLERRLWQRFWDYALARSGPDLGVKNAQIEAPGTRFVPGVLYTIRIEHDGGLRIDSSTLSTIFRGVRIPD